MTEQPEKPTSSSPIADIPAKAWQELHKAVANATANSDNLTKQGQEIIEKALEEVGKAAHFVGENPFIRNGLKLFRADWLLNLVGQVDVAEAEAAVKKLQQLYPSETPRQIANRIIQEKAFQAGGIGFMSSLIPGVALALLAVDLAATTRLQAEMVYKIAAAYGMDIKASTRRGEMLAIFGLGLGGSEVVKAGFGILRNIPLAGAVIGASTNTIIFYTLGYAACRFYETRKENQQVVPQ